MTQSGSAPDATLVSDRLRSAVGVWRGPWPPSFPIERSEIRRWAIAVHWPDPPPRLYWDEGYAQDTAWGGIVAPPEFNPFAWPVAVRAALSQPYHAAPDEPGHHLLNGGQEVRFGVRMRPGDVITERERIVGFDERQGRFGLMLYVRVERELRNQRNELVRTTIGTIVRY